MKVVSNSNGLEERAAAASPNLKLVPEPDWMGSERGRGREGGRLVNAKIEILGATDLYNGSEASVLLSSPRGSGLECQEPARIFHLLHPPSKRELANASRERGQPGN